MRFSKILPSRLLGCTHLRTFREDTSHTTRRRVLASQLRALGCGVRGCATERRHRETRTLRGENALIASEFYYFGRDASHPVEFQPILANDTRPQEHIRRQAYKSVLGVVSAPAPRLVASDRRQSLLRRVVTPSATERR